MSFILEAKYDMKVGDEITNPKVIQEITDNARDIYLAFYKGNYGFLGIISKLIRKWTSSDYSHCEFLIVTNDNDVFLIGASTKKGIRVLYFKDEFNKEEITKKWDLVKLTHNKSHYKLQSKDNKLKEVICTNTLSALGDGYDMKGIIFSNILSRKKHNESKYTCSEFCAETMDGYYELVHDSPLISPTWYSLFSPGDLFNLVTSNRFPGLRHLIIFE